MMIFCYESYSRPIRKPKSQVGFRTGHSKDSNATITLQLWLLVFFRVNDNYKVTAGLCYYLPAVNERVCDLPTVEEWHLLTDPHSRTPH